VKWANTDGGAWYIWSSPMVLPKTMRRANFFMKEALSIDCRYVGYVWWRGGGEDESQFSTDRVNPSYSSMLLFLLYPLPLQIATALL